MKFGTDSKKNNVLCTVGFASLKVYAAEIVCHQNLNISVFFMTLRYVVNVKRHPILNPHFWALLAVLQLATTIYLLLELILLFRIRKGLGK